MREHLRPICCHSTAWYSTYDDTSLCKWGECWGFVNPTHFLNASGVLCTSSHLLKTVIFHVQKRKSPWSGVSREIFCMVPRGSSSIFERELCMHCSPWRPECWSPVTETILVEKIIWDSKKLYETTWSVGTNQWKTCREWKALSEPAASSPNQISSDNT